MRKIILVIFFFILGHSSLWAQEKLYYAAPTLLPNTTREMKTAGFWISRHPDPDRIILSSSEIIKFNERLESPLNLNKDILKTSSVVSGDDLKKTLEGWIGDFKGKNFYHHDGTKADDDYYESIKIRMNLGAISKEIAPQFGLIVRFADQRFFPAAEPLYRNLGDYDFDELQNSDLDIATAVVILHQSLDKNWYFVQSSISEGWVQKETVAVTTRDELKKFASKLPFAVVVNPKADIYLDKELTHYHDYARMGAKFPMHGKSALDKIGILLPVRTSEGALALKSAHLRKEDAHAGYFSFTARNIIDQAFKLLNAPYGWGGMRGEQDCSRFLHQVFDTVGINLPRNSKEQIQSGHLLGEFFNDTTDEQKLLLMKKEAVGGITFFGIRGHIMLFLGTVEENPFVIHATWGYREKQGSEEVTRVINRVCVSDLSLGKNSSRGSLLQRINKIMTFSHLQQ
ncbi:MAG: SH3 domain-containing protein [Candidatus Omnitrophota bacterium]